MKRTISLLLLLLLLLALLPVQVLAADNAAGDAAPPPAQQAALRAGTYTVTFDTAGGTAVPPQQLSGTPAIKPEDPTRKGYAFKGWYKGDVAYTFEENVTENITLTAKWWTTEPPLCAITAVRERGGVWGVWNGFGKGMPDLYCNAPMIMEVGGFDFVTEDQPIMLGWMLTSEELTEDQMPGKLFSPYTDPITLDQEGDNGFFYAMYVDAFFRIWYVRTNRLIIDLTAPVISGVTDGGTYYGARTVTIADANLHSVYVNDAPITPDANGAFTLSPAAGKQTITARDKAGNETKLTVAVYGGARRSSHNSTVETAVDASAGIISPRTGDSSHILLWSVLLCASLATIQIITMRRRQQH